MARGRFVLAAAATGALMYAVTVTAGHAKPKPIVPVSITIPGIKIEAPLMRLGLAKDGDIELPPWDEPMLAGWFQHSVVPGDRGSSVIIGHIDTKTEPAIFYRLDRLRGGDEVRVERSDGRTARFRVESVEHVDKDRFPTQKVYGAVAYPGLRLITCGGAFDRSRREYRENVIVYAR